MSPARAQRSPEPLEYDTRGNRILKHGAGGYARGCGCEVCTEGHADYMWERREETGSPNRRRRLQPGDVYGGKRSVSISAPLMEALDQHCAALGVPRSAWIREAIEEKLEREGSGVTDRARRQARRRRNYEDQQREEGSEQ